MTTIKLLENYPHLSLSAIDMNTLQDFTLHLIPMRLFKLGKEITPTAEVYEKIPFEDGKPSSSPFNYSIVSDFETVKNDPRIQSICTEFYNWLEIDPAKYDLEMFDINLTNLSIRAKAVHKTNAGKNVEDSTSTLEEFEQIKVDYPNLATAYAEFVLGYALTHDERLAQFNG